VKGKSKHTNVNITLDHTSGVNQPVSKALEATENYITEIWK